MLGVEYLILLGCDNVSMVVKFLIRSVGYLTLKMKAPHSFDMSGMYTPNDMVSHPRSHEPSAIVL